MPRSWLPLIAIALVTSGCHTFTPTTIGEVTPGQEVRLRLDARTEELLEDVRLPGPRLLDGTFLRSEGGVVVVEAPVGTSAERLGGRVLIQEVDVPLSGITSVEIKKVDRLWTGIIVATGTAAVLYAVFDLTAVRGSEGGGGDGPAESRAIPVFRIGIPIGR